MLRAQHAELWYASAPTVYSKIPVAPDSLPLDRMALHLTGMLLPKVLDAAAGGSAAQVAPGRIPSWSHSPLVPLATLWAFLWMLTSLVEISARFLHDPAIPLWQPIVLTAIPTCPMIAWLIVHLRSNRYLQLPIEPPKPWFFHHLRQLPLLAIAYITIANGLRLALKTVSGVDAGFHGRLPYEVIKVGLFYCLWLGLVYGTLSLLRSREQSEQLARTQQALVESQLARLQAQLRPHFLFNTLNTVSALMQTDIARADRVLARLGDLLRASLRAGDTNTVPLQDEIRLLRIYTEIMEERFAGRIFTSWQVADDTLRLPIPAMLLQPLLENAFKHGIEQTTGIERITVTATRDADRLNIKIHNTGSALAVGWREGVGIANCRERLQVLYGRGALFDIANDLSSGVETSISLPLRADA